MSISTPFIRRPIATSLLTAAVVLAGLVAFPLLPVAPLPNVEFPTLSVTANYPGASPETMASTVATPLETQFGENLPGLAQMTSTSVLGSTQITLQFDLSTNLKSEETLVLEAINAAEGSLPKAMPNPPTFRELRFEVVVSFDAASKLRPQGLPGDCSNRRENVQAIGQRI